MFALNRLIRNLGTYSLVSELKILENGFRVLSIAPSYILDVRLDGRFSFAIFKILFIKIISLVQFVAVLTIYNYIHKGILVRYKLLILTKNSCSTLSN